MQEIRLIPAGDQAILMEFGTEISPAINSRIAATMQLLEQTRPEGLVDMTPAFCSLLVHYDPRIVRYEEIRQKLYTLAQRKAEAQVFARRVFEIPVCYGGDLGPDIETVAAHSGLSVDEVIALHSSCDYLIYMLGFLPGFPYLGGLDGRLHTPRLANPRLKIGAGSVGIGGSQTGIYPSDSPGGWQLLGMTPVKTYDPRHESPILFRAGDYIRFVSIDRAEYTRIAALCAEDSYRCVIRQGGT